MFSPPRMPEPLLQEFYHPDAWKVFVICMMLNCTQRKQVETVVDEFFERWPDAESLVRAKDDDVAEVIKSLGFKNRRTKRLIKFSHDFLSMHWTDPRELHGVGEYAARVYEMLFLGKFGDTPPDDHAAKNYWEWYMKNHHGV